MKNSPINKMALILGVSVFGVLIGVLILGKLLQLLGLPNKLIRPLISLIGAVSFLYAVVYLGDRMF